MKRAFDLFFGVILVLLFGIIMLFIAIAIRQTSKGPVLYWSDRIGKNNKTFKADFVSFTLWWSCFMH